MLRTNLSTRPFYNERVLYLALGAAGLLLVAFTVFNAARLVTLTREDRALGVRADRSEQKVVQLRQQAARARSGIDRAQLEAVVTAAREANALIDQRTFSWTELLNRLEQTLPPNVRIQSIRPMPRKEGGLAVRLVAAARRAEDVDEFVGQLEKAGGFSQVVSEAETTNPEGLLQVTLQGAYLPAR